jgi:tRNA A-37 threonylcarbamoyl transferase component Bud32
MAFVQLNPDYQELLATQGLATASQFLVLSGVILSGHPNRHVARVVLGDDASASAFLKREHRIPWRDRLVNAWQGFGFVSNSSREFQLLNQLRRVGIACPEPIAAGEDGRGRAFLLLREIAGARDLRTFLRENQSTARSHRCRLARKLGEALAYVHAAGFDHPDLYSKHVLVCTCKEGEPVFSFLDWARSRWRRRVPWSVRARDLAALDATLAEQLAAPRERLVCLGAYLNFSRQAGGAAGLPRLSRAAHDIRQRSKRLLAKRRIREQRQEPLAFGTQNLIWLDGEALCVTREFRLELGEQLPGWLGVENGRAGSEPPLTTKIVTTPRGRTAQLVRRRTNRPLARLWAWLQRRPLTSPELEQVGTLFRLQRYGIETPKVLAVGQRDRFFGQTESFLLVEPPAGTVSLELWLTQHSGPYCCAAERSQRRRVLVEAGKVLRRMHDAGCYFVGRASQPDDSARLASLPLHVRLDEKGRPGVVLAGVVGIRKCHRPQRALVLADLTAVQVLLAAVCSRSERLRFLLSYLQATRLTPAVRSVVTAVQRKVLCLPSTQYSGARGARQDQGFREPRP